MRIKDRYINPFTDFGFKKIFGSELNKDLLIDFINSLLPTNDSPIIDLNFIPNEQIGRSEFDRRAIFDLYCQNSHGEKFIVEMQRAKQNYFKDRSVFYASFPIQSQAKAGGWNFCLKAVYTIGILDFIFDEDKADDQVVHHEVKLVDQTTGRIFYDKLTFIYLELPKFKKNVEELNSQFDKWCYVLRHLPELTDRPARLQERVFRKLFELAEIACYSDTEYEQYEDSLKIYRDLKNVIDTAFDDGKAEGIAQGIAQGILSGREESMRKVIISMLEQNESIEKIIAYTQSSVEEVENIRKMIQK